MCFKRSQLYYEPCHEKTCLRGFRSGHAQTSSATETCEDLDICNSLQGANNIDTDQTLRMRRLGSHEPKQAQIQKICQRGFNFDNVVFLVDEGRGIQVPL